MIQTDLADFGSADLKRRLLFGGLPPFFATERVPEMDFQEWLDDYWAKDVMELFRLERRGSFQRFVELMLAQSGGIFEATSFRQERNVFYWRDKRGHEVDFVLAGNRRAPAAIECKWKADRFEPAGIQAFRRLYPDGESIVLAQDVDRPYSRTYGGVSIRYMKLRDLSARL